jgi:hypothetical protein
MVVNWPRTVAVSAALVVVVAVLALVIKTRAGGNGQGPPSAMAPVPRALLLALEPPEPPPTSTVDTATTSSGQKTSPRTLTPPRPQAATAVWGMVDALSGGVIGVGSGGIYPDLWLRSGDQFAALVASREDAAFRTNVAGTWTGGWVKVGFESFSASGAPIGTYEWDTRWVSDKDDGLYQFNGIADAWNLLPRDPDSSVFSTKIYFRDGPGRIAFYQTVVNNASGDAIFQYAVRFAADGSVWYGQ